MTKIFGKLAKMKIAKNCANKMFFVNLWLFFPPKTAVQNSYTCWCNCNKVDNGVKNSKIGF